MLWDFWLKHDPIISTKTETKCHQIYILSSYILSELNHTSYGTQRVCRRSPAGFVITRGGGGWKKHNDDYGDDSDDDDGEANDYDDGGD